MNRMLVLYMTSIPSAKGIELMLKEKDPTKTWPEHYQYLVYVVNSEQCVLQCLCKSTPGYIQSALLTRLNLRRGDHLQRASELVAFAIEYEANKVRQSSCNNVGRGIPNERGRFRGTGEMISSEEAAWQSLVSLVRKRINGGYQGGINREDVGSHKH
ncbi:hypothetical protein PHMEG_0004705 [Phytophthora megakarya]|uniref:Uncharacterized protein n=1 Tax=Phytophthora megakarya TaxID=4795 RepID=A0A225WT28_9STRA|nr:hypothetical protein PHMEG_0004705 [Phytophthora megakarya]